MQRVADIIGFVEQSTGHPVNREEGVLHGSAQAEVERVLICWQATREILAAAGEQGAELVIGHESLYYPYNVLEDGGPKGWEDWAFNRARREMLERHGLTFVRLHTSVDELTIIDDFAATLGLPEPAEAIGWGTKAYEIEPCTLSELIERVKDRMGMSHVRVSAPNGLDQVVSRIGLPCGGGGLYGNVGFQNTLLEMGCDALIAGEACSYGFRFSAECGVPMIETTHEGSENPGLARFWRMLQERFPDLSIQFVEVPSPWEWA
jgi:putative NIF3 family GTP cyclohydrolase 1 type 2